MTEAQVFSDRENKKSLAKIATAALASLLSLSMLGFALAYLTDTDVITHEVPLASNPVFEINMENSIKTAELLPGENVEGAKVAVTNNENSVDSAYVEISYTVPAIVSLEENETTRSLFNQANSLVDQTGLTNENGSSRYTSLKGYFDVNKIASFPHYQEAAQNIFSAMTTYDFVDQDKLAELKTVVDQIIEQMNVDTLYNYQLADSENWQIERVSFHGTGAADRTETILRYICAYTFNAKYKKSLEPSAQAVLYDGCTVNASITSNNIEALNRYVPYYSPIQFTAQAIQATGFDSYEDALAAI